MTLIVMGVFVWWRGANTVQDYATKRQVEDALGRRVIIPSHPKRVAVLNASHLDLYCAAGGAESVIAKPTSNALSDEVKALTKHAQEIGVIHSPDLEKIMALKPDLVIGINVPFHQAIAPTLEKSGIPMYIRSLDRYEDVIESLEFYGELTGRADQAANAANKVKETYERAVAISDGKERPRCLVVWGAANSFSMATSAGFAGDLLRRAGGENIADASVQAATAGAFVPLSMEYVAKTDPEVIFLITHTQENHASFESQFTDDPVWQGIRAVRENRVYQLPAELFSVNPGTRIGEAVALLTEYLFQRGKA